MSFEYDFRQRLMRLREQKKAAARTMSVALEQNPGYIHDIECGKSLPSLSMFLKICNYLGVAPGEFFDTENKNPAELSHLIDLLKTLDETQLGHITALVEDLVKTNSSAR